MEYGEDQYQDAMTRQQTIELLNLKNFELIPSLSSLEQKGDLVFKYKNKST